MSKKLLFLCLLLFTLSIQAQNVKMTGSVVDVDDLPLIGVNVVIKGTTVGTTTDLDGNFVLEGKNGDILVFSYIGMVSQEIEFKGQPLRVVLKDDSEALDEVVVIGYQTVKKSDLTGAVAVVDAKEMKRVRQEPSPASCRVWQQVSMSAVLGVQARTLPLKSVALAL